MFLLGSSFQVSIEASARLVELYEAVARALDVAPWEVRLTASTSYLISCTGGRLNLKPYQWRGFRFNAPCFFCYIGCISTHQQCNALAAQGVLDVASDGDRTLEALGIKEGRHVVCRLLVRCPKPSFGAPGNLWCRRRM